MDEREQLGKLLRLAAIQGAQDLAQKHSLTLDGGDAMALAARVECGLEDQGAIRALLSHERPSGVGAMIGSENADQKEISDFITGKRASGRVPCDCNDEDETQPCACAAERVGDETSRPTTCEGEEGPRLYRNESTETGRRVWAAVDRAAGRAPQVVKDKLARRGVTRFVIVDGDGSLSHEMEVAVGESLDMTFTRESDGRLISNVVIEEPASEEEHTDGCRRNDFHFCTCEPATKRVAIVSHPTASAIIARASVEPSDDDFMDAPSKMKAVESTTEGEPSNEDLANWLLLHTEGRRAYPASHPWYRLAALRLSSPGEPECGLCGKPAKRVTEMTPVKWGSWPEVEVEHTVIRCDPCNETLYEPGEMQAMIHGAWRILLRDHARPIREPREQLVDVVAAVRRDEAGNYWLCRRDTAGKHAGLANMWEYPGGKVEPNEQLRDALVRELQEEFPGVHPVIGRVLDSIDSTYGDTTYRVTFFEVEMEDPAVLTCHTEACWMSAKEACTVEHLPSGTIFNARHLGPGEQGRRIEGFSSGFSYYDGHYVIKDEKTVEVQAWRISERKLGPHDYPATLIIHEPAVRPTEEN